MGSAPSRRLPRLHPCFTLCPWSAPSSEAFSTLQPHAGCPLIHATQVIKLIFQQFPLLTFWKQCVLLHQQISCKSDAVLINVGFISNEHTHLVPTADRYKRQEPGRDWQRSKSPSLLWDFCVSHTVGLTHSCPHLPAVTWPAGELITWRPRQAIAGRECLSLGAHPASSYPSSTSRTPKASDMSLPT